MKPKHTDEYFFSQKNKTAPESWDLLQLVDSETSQRTEYLALPVFLMISCSLSRLIFPLGCSRKEVTCYGIFGLQNHIIKLILILSKKFYEG